MFGMRPRRIPAQTVDQDAWSYQELIDIVYRLVPAVHCPPQPPPAMKVRSVIEDLVGETVHQAPRLPHSSTVGATAQLLSELDGFVAAKKGFSVPVTSMRKLSAPNAYAVHSEKWPVKAPQLDPDASRIGIRANPPVQTSWQFVEGVENKLCLLYTSPSPRDLSTSRMPSSA